MTTRQNAHLTFKGNSGVARHDWLRLTPAYSYRLVREALRDIAPDQQVLDPFSGTGTTGLVAAEAGLDATLVDVNPFLLWLARCKTRNYSADDLVLAKQKAHQVVADIASIGSPRESHWVPSLHHIERWWDPEPLAGLSALRAGLSRLDKQEPSDDLLKVAFCRVMIACSNAAFNHQSMSFKTAREDNRQPRLEVSGSDSVLEDFESEAERICASASEPLAGQAVAIGGDSRELAELSSASFDVLYCSPPYANRMSYIRELRPYMYWLRYIMDARAAGELDWEAVGGTWGIATSRVAAWESNLPTPIDAGLAQVREKILSTHARNADLLGRYVHKYFQDMWQHFCSAYRVLRIDATCMYVVGNSTFYGVPVPTEQWYASMLEACGFDQVRIETIRKRNSKKELFEYVVSARKKS